VNDLFLWIETNVNFSGAAGELRAYWTANGQITGHSITLTAADFIL
jgi:hypothetical protein